MLQDGHEDGHLITLVTATGPGLEIQTANGYVPVELADDEMLIMPGSPAGADDRQPGPAAIPSGTQQLPQGAALLDDVFRQSGDRSETRSLVRNATNAGIDIVEQANALPQKFGLPTLVERHQRPRQVTEAAYGLTGSTSSALR